MLENNSLNKVITTFDGNENVSMTDSLKDYDLSLENIDLGKELDVAIIEENSCGFMVNLGMESEFYQGENFYKKLKMLLVLRL